MTGLYVTLGAVGAFVAGEILYLLGSPMTLVRLIRRSDHYSVENPPDYESVKATVEILRDLPYTSQYGKNSYDLYLPKGQQGRCPLVVWVHGGSFVAGDKSSMENWGVMLAAHGYAAALVNYERAPEAVYPAQLRQITQAIRSIADWAKEHGRIDMERIAIAGDSAGAHMASQFALLHTNPAFAQRMGILSPLPSASLKCALLYCGPFQLEQLLQSKNRLLRFAVGKLGHCYLGTRRWRHSPLLDTLTPTNFVTSDYVPSYITDGNTLSFESHGRALAAALRQAGVEVRERYFDKEKYGEVGHGYESQLATEPAAICLKDTLEFLRIHLDGIKPGDQK